MGVSETEFWSMNPRLLAPFVEADRLRFERMNLGAYLTGAYVRRAVVSCLCRGAEYPEKPCRITPMNDRERQAEAEEQREAALAFFRRLQASAKFARREVTAHGGGAD